MSRNPYESPQQPEAMYAEPLPAWKSGLRAALVFVLVGQLLMLGVFCLVDLGFDRPGQFGLDFGHQLLLIAAHFLLFWVALTLAILLRAVNLVGWVVAAEVIQSAIGFWIAG